MMNIDRRVIDLVKLSESLPIEFKKLKFMIIQLRDAHSIRTDLQMVIDFLGSMDQLRNKASSLSVQSSDENLFLGLLYSSIILYARATKTSSDHRKFKFDFTRHFDADDLKKHRWLCKLRDDAVAHFGPGQIHNSKSFQSDGVFVIKNNDGSIQIATLSQRIVVQSQLIESLNHMVRRAFELIHDRVVEFNSKLTQEFSDEALKSPLVEKLAKTHFVDLATFVGSEDAAIDILSGSRSGYRRGSARH